MDGVFIPLAWPETLVRTAGGKYDKFLSLFNVSRKGYYKAGHAAFLLISKHTGEVNYYDFGRYISKPGYGRVRGKETDPELHLPLKAEFIDGKISNLEEILTYLSNFKETHGNGTLYAGIIENINFMPIRERAREIQLNGEGLPYGPFVKTGTNCARFIPDVLMSSNLSDKEKFKFRHPWYGTPSPLGNIFNTPSKLVFKVSANKMETIDASKFRTQFKMLRQFFFFKRNEELPDPYQSSYGTIKAPAKLDSIPNGAQWLGGTGAGAWYFLQKMDGGKILVERYQKNGKIDFSCWYTPNGNADKLNFEAEYRFQYGSNYLFTFIEQGGQIFKYIRKH